MCARRLPLDLNTFAHIRTFNLKVSQMISLNVIFQIGGHSRSLSTFSALPEVAAIKIHDFLYVRLDKGLNAMSKIDAIKRQVIFSQ